MEDSFKTFTEYGVLGAIVVVLLLFIWAQYKDARKAQEGFTTTILDLNEKWRSVLESNTKVLESTAATLDHVHETLRDVEKAVRTKTRSIPPERIDRVRR